MKTIRRSIPLSLRVTLTISGFVLITLGAGLTFVPHFMAVLYGSHEASVGSSGARMAGAAIAALGVLAWVGRKQKPDIIESLVVPVLAVWFVLKTLVAYLALVEGVFELWVGRSVFILDLLLALVYCYFSIRYRSVFRKLG
jgi:hypothetical protein